MTAEYRRVLTPTTLATFRLGYSRTRIGQEVLANVDLPPFVPGREIMGAIDIGGIPRFGPQSSVNVQLRQDVYAFHGDFVSSRGRHLVKGGLLAERFVSSEYNPTFSLGIYTFPSLETFLRNRPQRFIGITPEGDFDRRWPFTLFGVYVQDDLRATRRLTLNVGLRYEFATLPEDSGGRDVNLKDLEAPQVTVGPLYANPTLGNVSPRLGFAWDVKGDGKTSVRGGYGLYYNTNSQQNLIVTVTNPPFTPRPVIANPTFPNPNFGAAGVLSIRPYVYEIESPRVHVWNVNVQRELFAHTVLTLGYAGARGQKLLRNTDANTALPSRLPDGTLFFPAGAPGRTLPSPPSSSRRATATPGTTPSSPSCDAAQGAARASRSPTPIHGTSTPPRHRPSSRTPPTGPCRPSRSSRVTTTRASPTTTRSTTWS